MIYMPGYNNSFIKKAEISTTADENMTKEGEEIWWWVRNGWLYKASRCLIQKAYKNTHTRAQCSQTKWNSGNGVTWRTMNDEKIFLRCFVVSAHSLWNTNKKKTKQNIDHWSWQAKMETVNNFKQYIKTWPVTHYPFIELEDATNV